MSEEERIIGTIGTTGEYQIDTGRPGDLVFGQLTEMPASPEWTLQGLVQRLCREPGWVLFAYNNGTTIDMVAGDSRRSPEMLHEITDRVQRIDIPDPAAPPKKKGAR